MQDNRSAAQPEIDLIYFFRPITKHLKKPWNALINFLRLLWRNRLLTLGIMLSFILAGWLLRDTIPDRYKTKAIYVSHIVPAWVCAEQLTILNKSVNVGQQLKTSEQAAASIRHIKAEALPALYLSRSYDSLLYHNVGDTAINGVEVSLYLRNQEYLDTIQYAISRYLSHSPYGQQRNEARRAALLDLKILLTGKTRSLDSVQQIVNESILPRKMYSTGDPINPVDVYDAYLYYNKQIIGINQELSSMDDVEILYPFTRFSEPNYPGLAIILIAATVLGILMALILVPRLGKKPKLP